ncbi:hypothetical protein [Telluria aromaticivorans]|uniref:Uncharacterized protein n=1 Tax=Telluria aromaticivorans TaxID=2725995 RepID=A0A7Y2P278_9BURK|nr:hypothetical protein [Telluria aromaticivorans]NNG24659.1 hypothetical protein [Telluria aromaticivorans]
MHRFFPLLLLLAAFCPHARSEGFIPRVDGEAFAKKSVAKPVSGDRLFEFIKEDESFDSWTKLIAYRYQRLSGLSNDPIKYAYAMQHAITQQNPAAAVKVSENQQTHEAVLDFVTWPKDQSYVELNVFRFVKSKDGNAVVSIQLANKFVPPKPTFTQDGVEKYQQQLMVIRDRRKSWIKQATDADLQVIEAELLKEQ